jgi:hypothetical protein
MGCFKRAPGRPLSSSINSTPAFSRAPRIAAAFANVIEPARPRLGAVRIVDTSASNLWAELAATFRRTRPVFVVPEVAKADLKRLAPQDAKEAIGHGRGQTLQIRSHQL